MKRKNVTAAMLAGLVAVSMALPAAAADTDANITINGSANSYNAYRLLDLTTSLNRGVDHTGEGHVHDDDCYNYSYTVNQKYAAILAAAAGADADSDKNGTVTNDEVIDYIGKMGDQSDAIRAFADKVFKALGSLGADATDTNKLFANVPQGYYLIAESVLSGEHDSRSLVMLSTAGHRNISVSSKEGVPVLTKQIEEVNDTTGNKNWQDAGDYDIGDSVAFRLMGTLPANYDNYETYKYVFHDNLSTGLKLNESSIKVTASKTGDLTASAKVRTTGTDGCTFEVELTDLKALGVEAGEQITVEYTAELLSSANIGSAGNDNKALLEFSNDPYDDTKTGKTPEDTVVAFTYKLQVDKVDKAGNALAGANFELQKEINGSYDTYKTIELAEGQTQFNFAGLDAGKYKLVETKVPSGYNKAEDIEFEVFSVYDTEADSPALTDLQVKRGEAVISNTGEDSGFLASVNDGKVSTKVVNVSGIHLPSTGGRGVYLVYGVGGLALLGAAGAVVIKKRKGNTEA